jgi:hypothetical protein
VDKMIEVRYAGVVVGRSAIVRELDTRSLFLGITEPLPVGTPVVLRIGDRGVTQDVPGKVEAVSESLELARAGMRVRFADPSAAVLFGTPMEAPPEPVLPAAATPAAAPAQPEAGVPAGATEKAAPDAPVSASPSGHRRIVVDASTERARIGAASESHDETPAPGAGVEGGRIPAPDPSAFGGSGGGRKGRRTRGR